MPFQTLDRIFASLRRGKNRLSRNEYKALSAAAAKHATALGLPAALVRSVMQIKQEVQAGKISGINQGHLETGYQKLLRAQMEAELNRPTRLRKR